MTFTLTIDCGNAAFYDDETGEPRPGPELARLLHVIAETVEDWTDPSFHESIHDSNGNDVGWFKLKA